MKYLLSAPTGPTSKRRRQQPETDSMAHQCMKVVQAANSAKENGGKLGTCVLHATVILSVPYIVSDHNGASVHSSGSSCKLSKREWRKTWYVCHTVCPLQFFQFL